MFKKDTIKRLRLVEWFKETEEPSKIEWLLLGITVLFCILFFTYADITSTVDESIMLIEVTVKGHFLDFFQYCIENKVTSWAPTYEIPIFIIFAIWNIPIYLLKVFTGFRFLNHPIALVWSKLELVLFLLGCILIIYKICVEIKINRKKILWIIFIFCTSLHVIIPTLLIAQVDIVSVFFTLLGIMYFIRSNIKRFVFWFSIAITMKLFALFVFIPLLLLKEKKIIKILLYTGCGILGLLLSKIPFINNDGYKVCMEQFSIQTVERMKNTSFICGIPNITVPIFVTILILICIFCYIRVIETEIELNRFAMYIPFVVYQSFFMFIFCWPYWYILIAPYIVIILFQNPKNFKINILLESISTFFIWLINLKIFGYILRPQFIDWMPLAKIFGYVNPEMRLFKDNPGDILTFINIDKYYIFFVSIYFACSIALIIINFPRKNQFSLGNNEEKIERGIMWGRFALILPFILIMLISYYSLKPEMLIDTTKVGYISSNDRILDSNASFKQQIVFNQDKELNSLKLLFFTPQTQVVDYASIVIEFRNKVTEKTLFKERIPINTLQNGQLKEIDLKGLKVENNTDYELCFNGMNDGGQKVYVGLTEQPMLGDKMPLYINEKEINQSLYMQITAKEDKNAQTIKDKSISNPNSEIGDVKFDEPLKLNTKTTARVTIKNTSETAWSEDNDIRLHVWENDKLVDRGYIAQGTKVAPGEDYTFVVNITPSLQGNNEYSFMIAQEGVSWFGENKKIQTIVN